jgi:hypothetical protein
MMSRAANQMSHFSSSEAIFISHATEDDDFVRILVSGLRQNGFEAWHQREMVPGGNYMKEIESRLDNCKAGIVVWSRASVSKEFVQAEADRQRERKCLVPFYIEECRPPAVFTLIQGIKCRKERSLGNEEVLALCAAINKIWILGNTETDLWKNDRGRNSTLRARIARVLPALHVSGLCKTNHLRSGAYSSTCIANSSVWMANGDRRSMGGALPSAKAVCSNVLSRTERVEEGLSPRFSSDEKVRLRQAGNLQDAAKSREGR